jgi:chemotaxis protein histidine kinase CheA
MPRQGPKDRVTELPGRGIGISSVCAEVRARGGSLRISSTPGRGTRIECRIPIAASGSPLHFAGGEIATSAE